MIRVLVADDHKVVQEGLVRLLSGEEDIAPVAGASNGGEVIDRMRRGGIDLVLMDWSIPGIHGVDLIERIRAVDAQVPTLVLTVHNDAVIARRALRAGARGYLTKEVDSAALCGAIRRVAGGGYAIAPELAEQMAYETVVGAPRARHEALSAREFAVMEYLARGLSVVEIASRLFVSDKTVSTYKARVMRKMGFRTNAELVRYALMNGIVG